MFLASIIKTDEDLLVCDFAEYYHIYDYRSLPLHTVAALCVGLRDNSRVKVKVSGLNMEPDTYLLSAIYDKLSILTWMQTKDGHAGKNPPKLILSKEKENDEIISFSCAEEFEKARERILKGVKDG